jgi:Clostripain family/PKD domain
MIKNKRDKIVFSLLAAALLFTPLLAVENTTGATEKEFDPETIAGISGNRITANKAVEWVIMFYQCGDNALSTGINVCLTLIQKVGATDAVKIAVLIDKKPINDTTLYYYEGTTPVEQEWPAESDLSDADTLVSFAKKVKDDYPAAHYCLEITGNKGSGWQGICYDEHGDELMITMPELFDALDVITENGCFKLDVLLIQTCLAGNLEFRYHVRQFCHYFVSYADCGLVGDFPFDQILADVVADPSMTAEHFAKTVVEHFTPVQYQNIYQALGATDETKLDDLADSIDDLAALFLENSETYNGDIQSALEVTRKYGLQFNIDYYVDLKDFLEHLTIDDSEFLEIKERVLECIEGAVVASVTLEGHPSCGFNFYFPGEKNEYNSALRYSHALPSPYEETLFAIDTQWDEFLKEYLGLSSNTPPLIPTIEGSEKGKFNVVQTYVVSAEDSQADDISFYVDWGDGSYKMVGPVSSGEEFSINHTWASEGTYAIKVKATDQYGAQSDWGTLTVIMPLRPQTLLERIMEWILQIFDITIT